MITDSAKISNAPNATFVERDDEQHVLQQQPRVEVRKVALFSGGRDKPYALGMTAALTSVGVLVDFIGSDEFSLPELHTNPRVRFLNLRGNQAPAPLVRRVFRVLLYYWRLIYYTATADAKVFHILWNNYFEFIDRSLLMLYYRSFGKKLVFTAHNVNARKRDASDTAFNRLSLKIQYRLCDHIFVHTNEMKHELLADFGVCAGKVSVIPFGINNTVPNSSLSTTEAKRQLGISEGEKTLLFFGSIAPYKGLEYLITAFAEVLKTDPTYRLIIAGKPKGSEDYWREIQGSIMGHEIRDRIIERIEYIPDDQTEVYFKAADVLALPYTRIFQSGVLFLGYSFGLPVIAADVGSLKEEIVEGETGCVFKAEDTDGLANTIQRYFGGELFRNLDERRARIQRHANERYSWEKVAVATNLVYTELLGTD